MGYKALYREYRPQRFADVVGQEHITFTLQNALDSGRVSHAYLFSGPRGTGKTTVAKILAKALNCLNGPTKEPCNSCDNCIAFNEGSSVDIMEIDAASNRGIEDIRDLREKVKYSPANGKYRIYIIDEVHMLTTEAFNALLKTIEEPPAHVVFILATTEPRKVPVTILSRCQRFDFRRITVRDMLPRLKQVAADAALDVEEKALIQIARAADGGLRDALSILDQGASFAKGKMTLEDVHNVLGTVREDVLSNMARCLGEGNGKGALSLVNQLYQQGKDLRLFARELSNYLRLLMLYRISGELPESELDESKASEDAQKFDSFLLTRCLELLSKLEYDMKISSQPRLLLELALVKLTENQAQDLFSRVEKLEKDGHKLPQINPRKQEKKETVPPLPSRKATMPKEISDPKVRAAWESVLEKVKKLKPAVYGVFREGILQDSQGSVLTIAFKPQHVRFHKSMAEKPENRQVLQQALNEILGGNWNTKIVALGESQKVVPSENEKNPLVQKAEEFFGKDKVEVINREK